jgi:hypothetical protein
VLRKRVRELREAFADTLEREACLAEISKIVSEFSELASELNSEARRKKGR